VTTFGRDAEVLAVLAEPQRARVYELLLASTTPPTVTEISQALTIGRTLTAFHLDRLQAAGLVEPADEAGAAPRRRGRPAMRYRAVPEEFSATVPTRRYDVLAEILVSAAREQGQSESLLAAGSRVARRRGREMAGQQKAEGTAASSQQIRQWLFEFGYLPSGESSISTRNCPFSRLRTLDTQLVCSLNVALVEGYLEGLGVANDYAAVLRPDPPHCCVLVQAT
jgi:predicted ArsR family transcriptional regulator